MKRTYDSLFNIGKYVADDEETQTLEKIEKKMKVDEYVSVFATKDYPFAKDIFSTREIARNILVKEYSNYEENGWSVITIFPQSSYGTALTDNNWTSLVEGGILEEDGKDRKCSQSWVTSYFFNHDTRQAQEGEEEEDVKGEISNEKYDLQREDWNSYMKLDSNPTDNNNNIREEEIEEEEEYIDSFGVENLFKINNEEEDDSPRCISIKVPRDYEYSPVNCTNGSLNNYDDQFDYSPCRNVQVEEMFSFDMICEDSVKQG